MRASSTRTSSAQRLPFSPTQRACPTQLKLLTVWRLLANNEEQRRGVRDVVFGKGHAHPRARSCPGRPRRSTPHKQRREATAASTEPGGGGPRGHLGHRTRGPPEGGRGRRREGRSLSFLRVHQGDIFFRPTASHTRRPLARPRTPPPSAAPPPAGACPAAPPRRSAGAMDPARTRKRAREPPAGPLFDIAPAPPIRIGSHGTMFQGSLSHTAALRRTLIDPRLAAAAMPASFLEGDDAESARTLMVCGSTLQIPTVFDECPVAVAFEAALDRAEQKFRAGRKDKHIGGELGSIVIRKKVTKQKKAAGRGRGIDGGTPTGKRGGAFVDGGGWKRARVSEPQPPPPPKPIDYTLTYRAAVKGEVVKAARARTQSLSTQTRSTKSLASACAREARKQLLKSVRVSDDSHRRGRRILRDVLQYWKREDKDRQEERKKMLVRAEEARRAEAEEREAQRQKNKLKFLLGQSEAFSSFLQAKAKATDEASGTPSAGVGIDDITGEEDEVELRRKSEANAAMLVAAHQKRLSKFDTDSKKRKIAAEENAQKAAADRDAVAKAVGTMNGVTDMEMEALRSDTEDKGPGAEGAMVAHDPNSVNAKGQGGAADGKPEVAAVKQPSILNCTMKDYQLRGLSWLVSLYDQGINGILADEMGLGKTLQTISFLAYLAEQEDNWGPFLVVSPKATLHNWQQEVTRFCPDLKVLPYWGSKADRAELRKYWSQKRMYRRDSEFQVCITSYETLTTDDKQFHRVKWQYLVLDEAQAIKNSSSSRWKALLQFPCRNRLLLTGTPLQNKLSELWSLLHFIMPTIFDSQAEFADWFAKDIEGHATQNKVLDVALLTRLRTLLDPFMLRRVKRDVESEMPPKTEVQLRCQLTGRQRKLYTSIRANIPVDEIMRSISGGAGGNGDGVAGGGGRSKLDPGSSSQLMNLVMQLRKVCNHPETFERRVPQSPFQFQATPPPSHVPLPPAVLSGGGPIPPMEVKLFTRPVVELVVPQALNDVTETLQYRKHLLVVRKGLWRPDNVDRSLTFLGCGFSVSEVCEMMTGASFPLWCWKFTISALEEQAVRLAEVYGSSGEVTGRLHWQLQQPRTLLCRRSRSVVLPGHKSPAELVVRETRVLRTSRVYIPPAAAPVPGLRMLGDPRDGTKFLAPESELFYPDMPRQGAPVPTSDVYEAWRELFGNFGEHVGTHSIIMPEAGRLVADSGKMAVLDGMLRRLRDDGHKCLIYSQFTKVLDILEDYCGGSGFKFVRLDGQTELADRRDIVADWQSNDELFIFLLSTRAGGVGLNLTAADTVIFYDSDWNPTQDLQAMDRAHRLGQERPVTVYRLTSRGTIEERMLLRAQQKSRINDLVIKGGTVANDKDEPQEAELDDIAALLIDEDEDNIDMKFATVAAQKAATSVRRTASSADLSARDIQPAFKKRLKAPRRGCRLWK